MDLYQLRCFVIAAEELHFGRAARKLEILPSVFGRNVRLLEEDLGTKLFLRTRFEPASGRAFVQKQQS